MNTNNMNPAVLRGILEKYATPRYSIEYRGFFSNHLSHGVVALAYLGATEERIEQFVTWYSTKLEKPEQSPKEMTLPDKNGDGTSSAYLQTLLGKRVAYYPLLEHYKKSFKEECGESLEKFISKHLPPMLEGIQCTALHPLIHTGYGYNAKCPILVIEGIAYLHHSFERFAIPENNTFGQGERSVMEVLEDIQKDDANFSMDNISEDELKAVLPPFINSNFQRRVAVLANTRSAKLASYVDQIKLPEWFKLGQASYEDVLRLSDWAIDNAITVYTASAYRNDFFFLHGVTGGWSLKQTILAMKGVDVNVLVRYIQEFLYALFTVYVAQKRPKLIEDYLKEGGDESWEQLIEDALATQTDEHIYKLVQVCHERAMTFPPEEQGLFKRASRSCMKFDFHFR